ncbi:MULTISPECIES: helix-turn-helix transcriptional regulator [Rhizobium]|uniref:Transcriptional regulator YheO n=2 Tax=Rhizobium tropici TaxID=398 RepID=A0ABR6R986_RHITR|nr:MULTISPECIES: PAS domain-containing protein [Rhizobium]AGB73926.1 YheO domain-containing protein [Rhizobium tropici CIAT 899]MBB4245391.1 putative transcriptional regulator YheO [Rhizobium tropici]MBB5596734.1 putative transcriptional regulator YheO [Rhizobium tropici]MBB6495742.1 putative transcriptional regulator YheO [Rhizobium tropici]
MNEAVRTKQSLAGEGMAKNKEADALFSQLDKIAEGLAETFAPFCEVVLHDLRDPKHAIHSIHNNLSDRNVGDPATELGLARIADPDYPQVIANYANQFADGRQAKSTSIGIKDASGHYVAALCLNIDLTIFHSLQSVLQAFGSVDGAGPSRESLVPAGPNAIRGKIDEFAARLSTTPRALKAEDRRVLLRELRDSGHLNIRRSMDVIAAHLGVSRATVYTDAK